MRTEAQPANRLEALRLGCKAKPKVLECLPGNPTYVANIGGKAMSKTFAAFVVTVFVLTAVLPLLSACHTVSGAGQDISATGQAIDKAAKKTTP